MATQDLEPPRQRGEMMADKTYEIPPQFLTDSTTIIILLKAILARLESIDEGINSK